MACPWYYYTITMGRFSQAHDYIRREPLPSLLERSRLYTHIDDFHELNRLRRAYRRPRGLTEETHEDEPRLTPTDRLRSDLGADPRRLGDVFENRRHTD